jgi:hypothetical protein
MKRFVLITSALVALVATGAAVAHLKATDVSAVSATLTATTPSNVRTQTYTCEGQTFEVTTGRWSGTSTSTTPDLNGAATVSVRSFYNATKKLGWVDGRLTIAGADNRTHAGFSAVNSDGKLDGWVRGQAGHRDGALFGSLSGSFSKTGGLTGGAIGSGTNTNAALLVKGLRCKTEKPTRSSVHLFVRGQIETVSDTSITVKPKDGTASQTCSVKSHDDVDRVKAGDRVEMICSQVSGAWVLTKVHRK